VSEPPSEQVRTAKGRYSAGRLFLVALLFIVAAPVFWHRTQTHPGAVAAAYENADLYQDIYPVYHCGFGRIRAGELPLWNPKQLCGTPFLANPKSGVFQPLNLIFAGLPTEKAMAAHAFTCLALMGILFVLFARSLDVGYVAALVGGVVYAFCGASAAAISRPALANALAWTPLLFWGVRACALGYRRGHAIPAGFALALVLFSGANALVVAILGPAVLYGLLLTFLPSRTSRPPLKRRIQNLLLALALAVAISAIQWAPSLVWLLSLDRPIETLWALDMPGRVPASIQEMLAQLLAPKPGALPCIGYIGAIALLAIPALLFHPRGRWDGAFFVAAAAMLLVVSVGGAGPIPFSYPYASCALPAMFCLAGAVALGFDRLFQSAQGPHEPRAWPPMLLVIPCAAALFYLSTVEPRGRIVVFALVIAPVAVFRVRWVSTLCGCAFAVLLFADLATASATLYAHPIENAPACYQKYAKSISTAEEQSLGARVLVSSPILDFGLPTSLGLIFPVLHDVDGRAPLNPDQAVWWRRLGPESPAASTAKWATAAASAASPNLLNFMAMRVLLAAPDSPLYAGTWEREGPRLREIKTEDAVRLFVNETALPRVSWVPAWRMAEGVAAAADMLGAATFDGARECTIDRDSESYESLVEAVPGPRSLANPLPQTAEAPCSLEAVTAERMVIRVGAPSPGITVLADAFDPGWKATLDGMPCPILRANGIFRGVATPAGIHEIVFEYRPVSFLVGMWVSLASLALLTLAGLVALLRE